MRTFKKMGWARKVVLNHGLELNPNKLHRKINIIFIIGHRLILQAVHMENIALLKLCTLKIAYDTFTII